MQVESIYNLVISPERQASKQSINWQAYTCSVLLFQVFVTSGLGGMSGAQAKAAVIAGCIGVIAEVNKTALLKRHQQG